MDLRRNPAITLRQLYHFALAAEAGKISEAAHSVRMAPSALSMSIAELERLVGAQLCVKKKSKGITLTPAGETVLRQARDVLQIVGDLSHFGDEQQGDLHGPLAVGCLYPLAASLLAPMLGEYNARHPNVDVTFFEEFHDELQRLVLDGALDLAFTYGLGIDPGVEAITTATIAPRALFAADHPLAKNKIVTPTELARYDFVLAGPDPIAGRVLDLFHAAGANLRVKHSTRSFATARALVGRSHFVSTVYEDYPVPINAEGRPLALRPIEGSKSFAVDIVLVRSRGVRMNGRSRAWIDLALEVLSGSRASPARVLFTDGGA